MASPGLPDSLSVVIGMRDAGLWMGGTVEGETVGRGLSLVVWGLVLGGEAVSWRGALTGLSIGGSLTMCLL